MSELCANFEVFFSLCEVRNVKQPWMHLASVLSYKKMFAWLVVYRAIKRWPSVYFVNDDMSDWFWYCFWPCCDTEFTSCGFTFRNYKTLAEIPRHNVLQVHTAKIVSISLIDLSAYRFCDSLSHYNNSEKYIMVTVLYRVE